MTRSRHSHALAPGGHKEMSSMSPNAGGGEGGVAGPKPMSTAVHMEPKNILFGDLTIFNLCWARFNIVVFQLNAVLYLVSQNAPVQPR